MAIAVTSVVTVGTGSRPVVDGAGVSLELAVDDPDPLPVLGRPLSAAT